MANIKSALVLTALLTACAAEQMPETLHENDADQREDTAPEVLAQTSGGDVWYYIQARHSRKCLHQYGATRGNGDPINQWDCVDQPNVQWRIIPSPQQGYYYIQARHSGKCLHQYGATSNNGDPINQWDCVDQPNVQWRIVPSQHTGYYYIQARHSGKCLHQYGATSGNGDPINQWDCVDQPNVQWSLQPVPGPSAPVGPVPPPTNPGGGPTMPSVTSQGAGCPAGSVKVSTDQGWDVMDLANHRVSVDPSRPTDRKDCALTLRVRVPQGEMVAIERLTYTGLMQLDGDVELYQELRPVVSGSPVAETPRTLSTRGPANTFYSLIKSASLTDLVWWPCGVDRDVTIHVTDAMRTLGQGRGATNAGGRSPQVRIKFVRRRC